MNKKHAWKLYVGGLTALVIGGLLLGLYLDSRERLLEVAFLNVGQGDAVYIETPGKHQMLIDGGLDNSILAALGDVMPFWDHSLDIVVATHPDKDHIGGLVPVFERYRVDLYIESGFVAETQIAERLNEVVFLFKPDVIEARRGMRIVLDERYGIYLDVYHPENELGNDRNEASVVMELVYGSTSFLFTGDAGIDTEYYLMQDADVLGRLDSDVLKLGHHGSKTSTSDEWLVAVTPDLAIVSAGEDSRYGHPHKEVVDRLGKFSIPYLETKNGTVVLESDGKEILVK